MDDPDEGTDDGSGPIVLFPGILETGEYGNKYGSNEHANEFAATFASTGAAMNLQLDGFAIDTRRELPFTLTAKTWQSVHRTRMS